jgi:Pro-kumamolisin, activation domain
VGRVPVPPYGGSYLHRSIARRAALAVLGLLALAPTAHAAGSTSRTALGDSTPAWATPSAQVGSVPDSAQRTFWVYLSLHNSQALDAAVAAVSNPASASYGHYLTPDQFRARYAPTAADADAVASWLEQAGFSVSSDRPANNRWIKGTGTTAQVERAFDTQLRTYRAHGACCQPRTATSACRALWRAASPGSRASTATTGS